MIKIINLFIIFLIFLILNNNNGINGALNIYEIKNEENFPHIRYPLSSLSIVCEYNLAVLVVSDSAISTVSLSFNLSNSNISPPSYFEDKTIYNTTSKIFYVGFSYVPVGSSSVTVKATLGSESVSLILNVTCVDFNVNEFKVNILGSGSFSNSFGSTDKIIFATIENSSYPIYNIDPDSSTKNLQPTFKNIENIYSNVFKLSLNSWRNILDYIFVPFWNTTIPFTQDFILVFNVNSTFSNSVNSTPIADSIYPIIQGNFLMMGQDYSPVYEFQLNSSIGNPFNIMIGESNFENKPRLLTSENGLNKYTTFYNLSQTTNVFDFYFSDNSNLQDVITGITLGSGLTPTTLQNIQISKNVPIDSIYQLTGFQTISQSIYNFEHLVAQFKSRSTFFTSPFSFGSGNNANCVIDFSFIRTIASSFSSNSFYLYPVGNYLGGVNTMFYSSTKTANPGQIISFESIQLNNNFYLFRIEFINEEGFNYIEFSNYYNKYIGKESLVSGTIYQGKLEFIYDIYSYDSSNGFFFKIYNNIDVYQEYVYGYPYSIYQPTKTLTINYFNDFININSIKNVTYYYNNLNIENKIGNRMYFNLSQDSFDINRPMAFQLNIEKDFYNSIDPNQYYPVIWNDKLKLFQVDFFIPSNSILPTEYVPFVLIINYKQIIYSEALPLEYQLRIYSDKVDLKGPVFTRIETNTSLTNMIGWKVTIDSEINNFSYGNIVVVGGLDNSIYEFNLVANNQTNPNNIYEIYIYLSNKCEFQEYIISNVTLYDTEDNYSHFSIFKTSKDYSYSVNPTKNPFINYLNDSKINKLTYECSERSSDPTPPELISFSISKTSIDVGSLDRSVKVDFVAYDKDTGLKNQTYPIVYILDRNLDVIGFKSSIVSINDTFAQYTCTIDIPIGFSYSSVILLSVYGFINNGGTYSGFSSYSLSSNGFTSYINASQFNLDQPIITNSNKFTTYGGDLWLYGKSLNSISKATITFKLDNGSNQTIDVTPNVALNSYSRALLIKGVQPTLNPIQVILYKSSLQSNQFTIVPIHFGIPDPIPEPSLPTNAPQKCLNDCGGSKKGICTSSGCVCIYPYYGSDCSSKIVVVPQPSTNNTDPTVIIPIPNDSNNTSSSEYSSIIYKSFISMVSIREINIHDQVVRNFTFKQWIYTNLNEYTNQYYTNLSTSDENGQITEIYTTIQWFNVSTNISFAGSTILMNPYSMKYQIEINNYNFQSSLNTLQLIMSASLEAESNDDDDICSSKEFGDTSTGDNSNYLKIQIDNHSLYGRFIKRGIVDNKFVGIGNQLLDSSFNVVHTSSQSQSFIAINIPHFKNNVTIDPDFSVLIDSSSVSSSSPNSICNNSNSSSLSGAKIAGIIVSCVAFLAVVVIVITYFIFKNKKQKQFLKNIHKKLNSNNIDNSKL